jgi:hypothetical protein
MKIIPVLSLAVFGFFSASAQAALPQSPEAAQTSVAQIVPAASAQVSVPRLVQFSGTLKDSAARSVTGLASVTFAIYAEQDGGVALWSETQNVTADANGHYSAVLGVASATGVPQELFGTGQSRWLGVQIARQAEMPRVLLVSVPYALKAADAEMLGGQPASAFVTTQALAANNVAIRPVTSPAPASSTNIITSTPLIGSPTGAGTPNFLTLWTSGTTLGTSALFQSGSNIGLNTTSPAELLDVNGNSIWRGSFQLAPDHPATASSGFTSHSFQFQATSFNSSSKTSITNAFGFLAVPLGNNTSSTSAKLDLFYGPNSGALVDTGLSYSTKGVISAPSLVVNSNTGSNIENPSTLITLTNSANTNDNTGSVAMDFNPVIFSGTHAPAARIQMEDDGDFSSYVFFSIKQRGSVNNSLVPAITIEDDGSVDFGGDVNVTGAFTKGSGTFKIDDPIAPAEKYLSHSFVESPDMMNIYNGTVALNAKGEAIVQMPEWFDALNCSFQYQLTAVGGPGPGLYIAEKVHDNQFKIAGGTQGLEVSWQVTGVRHDAFAIAHPTPVEEMKPANEQGHYLHPELFGAGPDKSISAAKHPQHSTAAPAAADAVVSPAAPAVQPVADQATAKQAGGSTR